MKNKKELEQKLKKYTEQFHYENNLMIASNQRLIGILIRKMQRIKKIIKGLE